MSSQNKSNNEDFLLTGDDNKEKISIRTGKRTSFVYYNWLSSISAVLYSNSGIVPLANRKYSLQLEKGEILKGKTDTEGYLQHLNVPPGDYTLIIDNVKSVIPTVADPNERLSIRVRGYFFTEGDQERESVDFYEDEGNLEEGDDWEDLEENDKD